MHYLIPRLWARRLVCLVAPLLALATPTLADEVWVCKLPENWSDPPVVSRYWLHSSMLQEIGQPFRVFNVLSDTNNGIVAVAVANIDENISQIPDEPSPIIGLTTFAIDRRSGDSKRAGMTIHGVDHPPIYGKCHLQREGENGAVWPNEFKGKKD
jgi:hypothetical protein